MSVAEALQLMLNFGNLIIALLTLVIALILLNDKKK
ncbi:putative holin-like toxin [Streptococcus hillyeri]|nr:putative holin-like toxin [Streptococcus hillyeri]